MGPSASPQHGDLIAAVREAIFELQENFSVRDVESYLSERHGRLMLISSRKSVSSALRRLRDFHEIACVREGRGTFPAIYSVNGKEAANVPLER